MPYITQERRQILQPLIEEMLRWMDYRYPPENVAFHLKNMFISIYFPAFFDPCWVNDELKQKCSKIQQIIKPLDEVQNGDINYLLCSILIRRFDLNHPRYIQIEQAISTLEHLKNIIKQQFPNDLFQCMVGTIECAKLELYRRLSWYEDKKSSENGDVFERSINE